ncbi:CPBP family intramembrane glutamic endopeptidase [Maricaulis sp.]|uniref:CPBP family intramembrane glutamic endopeptidase n=1 Tax=Maricaulis sp. TaxID=1486257 RepID=UPI003A8F6783
MQQILMDTLVQLIVVGLVCSLAWLIFARKRSGLRAWLGLTLPPLRAVGLTLLAALVIVPASLALFVFSPMNDAASGENTVAAALTFLEGGWPSIVLAIVLLAVLKTALAEEIFFRGLIAKRLVNGLGFSAGNLVQALAFGAVHLVIFIIPGGPAFDPVMAAGIVGVTGFGAWVSVWLNEKPGQGSIMPGWILHALTNAVSYPVLAFGLG